MLIFGRRELSCDCREGKEEAKSGLEQERFLDDLVKICSVGQTCRKEGGKEAKKEGRKERIIQTGAGKGWLKKNQETQILNQITSTE